MAGRYGLQIRSAAPADADGIAELMCAVGPPVSVEAVTARLAAMRDHACCGVLIAVEWGPPSGMLAFHWHPTPGADMPFAQIDWLGVAPDERRRGIARTLLKSASQASRVAGCGSLSLAVPPHADASLQALCDASGFERSSVGFTRSLRKTRNGV